MTRPGSPDLDCPIILPKGFLGYYLNTENAWLSPSPFNTPSQLPENFSGSFNYCYQHLSGGVGNTILHPQACGGDMKMAWLEKLVQYVYGHDDVWFTTMREATDAYDDNLPDPSTPSPAHGSAVTAGRAEASASARPA